MGKGGHGRWAVTGARPIVASHGHSSLIHHFVRTHQLVPPIPSVARAAAATDVHQLCVGIANCIGIYLCYLDRNCVGIVCWNCVPRCRSTSQNDHHRHVAALLGLDAAQPGVVGGDRSSDWNAGAHRDGAAASQTVHAHALQSITAFPAAVLHDGGSVR